MHSDKMHKLISHFNKPHQGAPTAPAPAPAPAPPPPAHPPVNAPPAPTKMITEPFSIPLYLNPSPDGSQTSMSATEPKHPLLLPFVIPDENGPARRISNYKREEVVMSNECTTISIGQHSTLKPFSCGELIYKIPANYGKYTVDIIPSSILGHVTGFFLIAGDVNEIDIEFTGADSTLVWLNIWKERTQSPKKIQLDFDAAHSGWHTYSMEWRKDFIAWCVDGKEVLRRSDVETRDPRTTTYKLALNNWCSDSDSPWARKFVWPGDNVKVQSKFRNLRYEP